MRRHCIPSLLCAALALATACALAGPPHRGASSAARKHAAAPVAPASGDTAFLMARDAYRAGDAAKLSRAAAAVGADHVLMPYVEFWQVRLRLEDRAPEEVQRFLDRQSGTLLAEYLRRDWLKVLGKQGDWTRFREQLPLLVNDDPEVGCYALAARWQQGDQAALAELKTFWLAPRELPEGCRPLVQAALSAPAVASPGASATPVRWDSAQLWQRFRLLTEANLSAPAKRVLELLPREEAPEAKLVDGALASPIKYLERPAPDLRQRSGREVYILAVSRVSRNDPALASSYWDARVRERFSVEDQAYVLGLIAANAARRHMPEAVRWYQEVAALPGGNAQLSDEQLAWRARIALRQGDWTEVLNAIVAMSPSSRADSTWVYWAGRAYRANGGEGAAKAQFERIAGEHSFYGRLAAEELGRPPSLPDNAPGPTAEELAAAAASPGLQRALALYRLEMRSEGMREWLWAIRGMDDRALLAAAELARSKEIWDRAINTADRTLKEHNFSVRYLAPYRDVLGSAARAQSLDEPLVLGVVRQESRFMSFAKSGVGAAGLMQLMPATAAWVARKMGLRDYAWSRVHQPEMNARLGTFYLRQVLADLDGLPVVAAAAYNAGPGRARRWRDARPMEGAIYAETIPLAETRDYAKKVMANSIYYAALLGEPRSLKSRLGVVGPRPADDAVLAQRSDTP